MTDEQKKMAGLIKRLKAFAKERRVHGDLVKVEQEMADVLKMKSRTAYHHYLATGRVPNYRVEGLDAFLTGKGY